MIHCWRCKWVNPIAHLLCGFCGARVIPFQYGELVPFPEAYQVKGITDES
jgi:hypothetical protein